MCDRPDDISKEAWEAMFTRWLDQARREGYVAGVRAAAEVADAEFVKWQTRQESSVINRADLTEIAVHGAAKNVSAGIVAQIRALLEDGAK